MDMRLAYRFGLVLLLAGCAIAQTDTGLSCSAASNTFGPIDTQSAVENCEQIFFALADSRRIPQPPTGCSTQTASNQQVNEQCTNRAPIPGQVLVIADCTIRLQCGATIRFQANAAINTTTDATTIRNANVPTSWTASPTGAPTPAGGPGSQRIAAPTPSKTPSGAPAGGPGSQRIGAPTPAKTPTGAPAPGGSTTINNNIVTTTNTNNVVTTTNTQTTTITNVNNINNVQQTINYPVYQVTTTNVNGQPVNVNVQGSSSNVIFQNSFWGTPPSQPGSPVPVCASGGRPVCRFVIDSSNVCCRDQGIVTSSYWADLKLVCSEPIVLAPTNTCVLATGPNSYSVRNQAFVTPPTYQLIYGNLTNQYNGTITVKLNQTSPLCSLPLVTPCQYNGQLYTNAAQVDDFAFSVVAFGPSAPATYFYNYLNVSNDLILLNSVSWLNVTNNATCASQLDSLIPTDFYGGGWQNYIAGQLGTNGFQQVCNTATGQATNTQTTPAVTSASQQTG